MEARDQVAVVALDEERHRQTQHVAEQAAGQGEVEAALHVDEQRRAHEFGPEAKQGDNGKGPGQRQEQLRVTARDHVVDGDLHVPGREEQQGLEEQRQRDHLRAAPAEIAGTAEQRRERQAPFLADRLERLGRRELHRHTGEVLAHLLEGQPQDAACRVVNHHAAAAD